MGLYLRDSEQNAAGEPSHVAGVVDEGGQLAREDTAKTFDGALVEHGTVVVVDLEKTADGVEAIGVANHRDGVGEDVVSNALPVLAESLRMISEGEYGEGPIFHLHEVGVHEFASAAGPSVGAGRRDEVGVVL